MHCTPMARHLALKRELNEATDELGERTSVHGLAKRLALFNGVLGDGGKDGFEFG
jgi:hypothetical protein